MRASTVIGLLVLTRNGDRLAFHQDPNDYSASFTKTTALGEVQAHLLGQEIQQTYFEPSSPSFIRNMSPDVVDTRKIKAHVKAGYEGNVAFDSAIAFLQGLFPPNSNNRQTLANDTVIVAPLGGYQYVPVETVEPANDRSLESWTDCPAFERHISEFYKSASFLEASRKAQPFLDDIQNFIFGIPATLQNMWNIHDYVISELIHNKTYAYRLPPTLAEQARHWANYHENGVFSDPASDGIGNIAARTLLHLIVQSMERISFNNDPLQFMFITTTYQPFISLFHLTEATKSYPALAAIPNYAASVVIELRRSPPPDVRDFLRFKFKNGTEDAHFHDLRIFGHDGEDGIPLTEFIYRTEHALIKSNAEWYDACHTSLGFMGVGIGRTGLSGIPDNLMAIFLASSLLLLLTLSIRSMMKSRERYLEVRKVDPETEPTSCPTEGLDVKKDPFDPYYRD